MLSIESLRQRVDIAGASIDIESLRQELADLNSKMQDANFWQSSDSGEAASRQSLVAKTVELHDVADSEVGNLVSFAEDVSTDDLNDLLMSVDKVVSQLEEIARFSGPYDSGNAVLYIYAGAGGDDAQDWAEILLRMYSQWAESNNCKTAVIETTPGAIAGVKSAAIEIKGENVYGKLSGEHGVHRLVRISPFNSGGTRETSFAKVDVLPEVNNTDQVEIDEKDLRIDYYRSGGKGGQSVNTTDSAVRITHIPTQIVVAIQNERSQIQNRETAMKILRGRLAQLMVEQQKQQLEDLKGPNKEAAWGNQIRNYVMHPYKMVKDTRTGNETANIDAVLAGDLQEIWQA